MILLSHHFACHDSSAAARCAKLWPDVVTATIKITGPRTAAGKTCIGLVNLLYKIMFKIRKIKPNSGSVCQTCQKLKNFHGHCGNHSFFLHHSDFISSLSLIIQKRLEIHTGELLQCNCILNSLLYLFDAEQPILYLWILFDVTSGGLRSMVRPLRCVKTVPRHVVRCLITV